jgi:ABC-type cobalamin/Fe3+-siderophores transport system ATPase subunit
MNGKFQYKLPKLDNTVGIHVTNNNSLIIIGANGSGKSKLGAWIEQQDMENVHRVGAQRSLNFGEIIPLKGYEQAENMYFYGSENVNGSYAHMKNKIQRWDLGKYTTTLINDYEHILAALIGMKNMQNDNYIKDCREKETLGQPHNNIPETVVDMFKKIWHNVFPQRNIDFIDVKVTASFSKKEGDISSYNGFEMSDGERVGLYLIAQCLCLPQNKTIIIDEPEIHLHRSIMNCLWAELEKARQDCFFIYITHDTQFAANHKQSKKIWVKSFDGKNWDWEEIEESNLPEQLLLDILGNRKNVLFVEGEANSYDVKLYREMYKNYYVIPCGSCNAVIERTKTMKDTHQLHDLKCFGIIDRDYRSSYEIDKYKDHNIYTVKVAEVENLFLVEELLQFVSTILANSKDVVEDAKNYIINKRFSKEINKQILKSTICELKYQLSIVDISDDDEDTVKQNLVNLLKDIDFDNIKTTQEEIFNNILKNKDYYQILFVFNQKKLVEPVGEIFGLKKGEYCELIIRHLQGEKSQDVINAIKPYLPPEIPME